MKHTEPASLGNALLADDAAKAMGIARRTLNKMATDGRIAMFHHAGRAWVSQEAIRDYFVRRHREADQRRAAAEKRAKKNRSRVA